MFRALFGSKVKVKFNLHLADATSVLHITDSEGDYSSFANSIIRSSIVEFDKLGHLNFQPMAKNPFFIYGGDLTDRGVGDLELLERLVAFKKRHPERVFLLAGNREASKTRFHTELHPKYIRERLIRGTAPYWLQSAPHTVPSDYVKKHMIKNGKFPKSGNDINDYVNLLHLKECQLIYLKWMLEENLSCPYTFSYHAQQLATQLGKELHEVSDHMVLDSFLKLTSPNGLMGEYLKHAQAGVIIPNTGILAVHGGLTPINTGRIPGMIPTDKPISDARVWINQFNRWVQKEVKKWLDSDPGEQPLQLRAASSPLDTFSITIPSPFRTVVTASMLDDNRQFISVPEAVSSYLIKNDISVVLMGHQPCGDHPAVIRSDDERVVFINGDTGYANAAAKNEHDTRGPVSHTMQIFSEHNQIKIDIDACLLTEERVSTVLKIVQGKVLDEHYIGKLLPGNELVQCQLSNGDYRTIHQSGFSVRYSVLTPVEVKEKLNLSLIKRLPEFN
ncbi:MAG: metallophosphoesterase [Legionella longbeachae]|nr:metallophosphoesterase [Legionella longbeachae]